MVIFGDMFSPSQVWAGGKSRKSTLTSSASRLFTTFYVIIGRGFIKKNAIPLCSYPGGVPGR